jgi:flagellum-specific peptidoglycan hydrolase FlgJ
MSRRIQFAIAVGDVANFNADVLFLKHAQGFYGADAKVVGKINESGLDLGVSWPEPGDFKMVETKGSLPSPKVMFLGLKPLWELDYQDIYDFGFRAAELIARHLPCARHAAMTMHGSGIGLDEIEAAQAQVIGCRLGLQTFSPPSLERITWVEINKKRADRLRAVLSSALQEVNLESPPGSPTSDPRTPSTGAVGLRDLASTEILSDTGEVREVLKAESSKQFGVKSHVLVAMPFSPEFDDIFYFGIQSPVRKVGYLCERIDQDIFTGDVLERIKQKIETASIVIGELTGNNPNVYLEIGYAWGKGRPTVLLTKEEPKFDVRGQRVLRYRTIRELNTKLARELRSLKKESLSLHTNRPDGGIDSEATRFRTAGGVNAPSKLDPEHGTFLPEVIAAAQAAHIKWKIPASVALAQWALESKWGKAMPVGSNNPFRIKAAEGQPFVEVHTREAVHGGCVTVVAKFRKLASLNEAFDQHGELLAKARDYAYARTFVREPNAFADALTGVYATDPRYGSLLKGLMKLYNLYQYD